jgi:hypothetical protein
MIVIENQDYSIEFENVMSVGRALTFLGEDVKIWDSKRVAAFDMFAELKPDSVIHSSKLSDRVMNKFRDRLIDASTFNSQVISDPVVFRKMQPSPAFQVYQVCLLQFPEVENIEDIVLKQKMSVKNIWDFRLFSVIPTAGAKYCGWIPKEFHSITFSSAKNVLALSSYTAINAALCNDNVTISINGKEEKYSISTQEILQASNIEVARRVIEFSDEQENKVQELYGTLV